MGFTTKLTLHKARIKNDGTYPLVLRVTYYRKVIRIHLGHCFKESDWDDKNQRVKSTCKIYSNITRLNNLIRKQEAEYYDKISALELSGELASMTQGILKAVLTSEQKDIQVKPTVYEFIDTLIAEKLQLNKKGSALSYRGVKRN